MLRFATSPTGDMRIGNLRLESYTPVINNSYNYNPNPFSLTPFRLFTKKVDIQSQGCNSQF